MKRILALIMVLVTLAVSIPAAVADTTKYVYTKNGGTLNVRTSTNTKTTQNIIGKLKYGTRVRVISTSNGWAKIRYRKNGKKTAYVSSKFLQSTKPAAFKPAAGYTAKRISVKPSKDNNLVNFRVGAGSKYEIIARFKKGYVLKAVGEYGNWYKAVDTSSGVTGWISKKYVKVLGNWK